MTRPASFESSADRLKRRVLTIPAMFLGTGLAWALAPVGFLLAGLWDVAAARRWRTSRFLAFGLIYGLAECVGLVLAGGLALLRPVIGRQRFEHANFALEAAWASALLRTGMALLSMSITVSEETPPGTRPVLVFCRHASLIDSLIPGALISARHGTRLRYVMKRELLFDPCLDVVGQRIPNAFVRRGTAAETEVEAIRTLAVGLEPGDGVLIFPEGTRFTEEKRARALERIRASGDPGRIARAEKLKHLLPIRGGGALALLDGAEGADVLFLAHHGFEGGASLAGILGGALIGRHIEVSTWRVDADEIPRSHAERLAWLESEWARMDRWLQARNAVGVEGRAPEEDSP